MSASNAPVTMTWNVRFQNGTKGQRKIRTGPSPKVIRSPVGRVPRISRLMALAIKLDGLVRSGVVKDYAELARVGMVSRARVTQIMNLNLLAPSIQEELLFLPRTVKGRDAVTMRDVHLVATAADWGEQKKMWNRLANGLPNQFMHHHASRCPDVPR